MNTFKYICGKVEETISQDSGLDLYCPKDLIIKEKSHSTKIDLGIKGAMYDSNCKPIGYMLVPRSSTGLKTTLRLSNSVGIIDSTYRGPLIAVVDNLGPNKVIVAKDQRLFQIVCFNGLPIKALRVPSLDQTERNEGGFGSTGK